MKEPMIFAYFMGISNHMWDDENTPPRGWYLDKRYTENNNIDIPTWDTMIPFLAERRYNMLLIDVGDGIRYESHPEISAPDAWDKDLLREKLRAARAAGLEPIPKLNFSCCHHTWLKHYRRMVSTPEYYRVVADLIREVSEVFDNPRYFHVGMDEENEPNQRFREQVHIRHEELWWHDLYFYLGEVEKYGSTPWVWSDYCWDFPTSFLTKMPKSVLQSNWFYEAFKTYPDSSRQGRAIQTYRQLAEHGFRQVPCCSCWDQAGAANVQQTLAFCRDQIDPASIAGYMVAAWARITPDREYQLKNDAHTLYAMRKRYYPETL